MADGLLTWKSGDHVFVRLRRVPPTITTWDLYVTFHNQGPLETIELYQDRNGYRDGTAKLKFRPPPETDFWSAGRFALVRQGDDREIVWVEISLDDKRAFSFVPSPVNPMVKYPPVIKLRPLTLDFGYMHSASTMVAMHSNTTSVTFQLDLIHRSIEVQFRIRITDPAGDGKINSRLPITLHAKRRAVGSLNREERYKFRIPIGQVQTIYEAADSLQNRSMIIALDAPPYFFRKAAESQLRRSHEDKAMYWSEGFTWFRQTDIVYDPLELKYAAMTLKKSRPVIDIGRWTTYRFIFTSTDANSKAYKTMRNALQDFNVSFESIEGFEIAPDRALPVWNWIDRPATTATDTTSFLAEIQADTVTSLTYPVRYQLEVCISQGCLNEHNLSQEFAQKLSQMEEQKALQLLKHAALQKQRIYDPMSLFDLQLRGRTSEPAIPHYCAYTRKAIVTPTMIYFNSPMMETSNRVIRQYIELSDRFLRVQFTDEKQGRIQATDKTTNDEIFTRIRRALMNGITIGDVHFEFLAFGNSQFREHGAYFFAPTLHLRTDDIKRWMGHFSHIRSVALYAARLGQCFSTTRAINGTRVQVREIADVVRNHHNFTDGVGKISESLAKIVAGELRLNFVPSVLQFRLGGCKGILTISPEARGWEIHIRESQYKFAAVHNGLEIIRVSQFAAASLNRQIIVVLSTLGVPDGVFVQKLLLMLAAIQRAMEDQDVALEMLQKYIDPNQMTLTIAGMVREGFMQAKDPFVMSLLNLWRAWSIKYLKERAKITIDDGAFVFGCTDETDSLRGQYHHPQPPPRVRVADAVPFIPEIFLQVPDPSQPGKYKVVTGICILARNPSLHPGDIRVVHAVDRPLLHHIRDAVVLPQSGDRDVASMCSGGDLDGDDFLVMWDKDLLPPEWNHAPMDYSAPTRRTLDRDVQKADITDFFVQYMKNDTLPTIAHAHLVHADIADRGAKDERCLRLAELHSKAVDYVKSGEPATMPKELRPRKWPHFMEKRVSKEKTYISGNVLGQLYDHVERVDFAPCYHMAFNARILDAYPLEADMLLHKAREVKQLYDIDMRRLMAQHEIETEFEVWSTFVLKHSTLSGDYAYHEEMGRLSFSLKQRYQELIIAEVGGKQMEVLGPFVAAMYRVTHQEIAAAVAETRETVLFDGRSVPKRRLSPTTMPLMSFPWCFADVLARILNEGTSRVDPDGAVRTAAVVPQKAELRPSGDGDDMAAEDVLVTAEGDTHRGEILHLFEHDDGPAGVRPSGERAEMEAGGSSSPTNTPPSPADSPPLPDQPATTVSDGVPEPAASLVREPVRQRPEDDGDGEMRAMEEMVVLKPFTDTAMDALEKLLEDAWQEDEDEDEDDGT
ncbi:MAG: hypothetical protein M1826_000806 [Phylliscum demangeonii]|nr:MAG: hypothetical protein M1826_000806 [Phylliscum demangeonii]